MYIYIYIYFYIQIQGHIRIYAYMYNVLVLVHLYLHIHVHIIYIDISINMYKAIHASISVCVRCDVCQVMLCSLVFGNPPPRFRTLRCRIRGVQSGLAKKPTVFGINLSPLKVLSSGHGPSNILLQDRLCLGASLKTRSP